MELWDIIDENGNPTGRTIRRGEKLREGDFHLVVHIWIVNDKGELLIQKRADNVSLRPGMWATTGGSAVIGEDSVAAAIRETGEEIGVRIGKEDMELVERLKRTDSLLDLWLVRKNISVGEVRLQAEEVSEAKWVGKDELLEMINDGRFVAYNYLSMLLERIYG